MIRSDVQRWAAQAVIERPLMAASPEKAAIVAHYSESNVTTKSVSAMLRELVSAGYQPMLVSTCPSPHPLEWPHGLPDGVAIVRRENLGYDFGSWGVGLEMYHGARKSRHTILTNDSMSGPFASLSDVIFDFEAEGSDVWGLTSSDQIAPHIQSYFLGFSGGVLNHVTWRRFFRSVRNLDEKLDYVFAYEFSVMRRAIDGAYSWAVRHEPAELGLTDENPTLFGWRELLDLGVPLVKRTILKEPGTAPDGYAIAAEIQRRYGVDIRDWIEEAG